MSPERFPPDDPREWLNRARSSLALAKTRPPEAYLEDLCFEAQQAAEEAGEVIPATIREAEGLTRYAVVTRYPGLAEPVTEAQYEEAMATTEAVIRWAANRLRELG